MLANRARSLAPFLGFAWHALCMRNRDRRRVASGPHCALKTPYENLAPAAPWPARAACTPIRAGGIGAQCCKPAVVLLRTNCWDLSVLHQTCHACDPARSTAKWSSWRRGPSSCGRGWEPRLLLMRSTLTWRATSLAWRALPTPYRPLGDAMPRALPAATSPPCSVLTDCAGGVAGDKRLGL